MILRRPDCRDQSTGKQARTFRKRLFCRIRTSGAAVHEAVSADAGVAIEIDVNEWLLPAVWQHHAGGHRANVPVVIAILLQTIDGLRIVVQALPHAVVSRLSSGNNSTFSGLAGVQKTSPDFKPGSTLRHSA